MKALPTTLPIRTWLLLTVVAILVVPQLAVGVAWRIEQSIPAFSVQGKLVPAYGVQDKLVRDVEANIGNWSDPAWQAAIRSRLAAAGLNMALQDSTGRFVFLTAPIPVPGFKFSLALRREPAGNALIIASARPIPPNGPTNRVVPASPSGNASAFPVPIDGPPNSVAHAEPAGNAQYVSTSQKPIVQVQPRLADVLGPSTYVATQKVALPDSPEAFTISTAAVRDAQGQINRIYFWAPEDPTLTRLRGLLLPASWLASLLLTLVVAAWLVGRAILQPLAAMSHAARNIAAGDLDFQLPDSGVREVAEVGAAFRAMGDALGGSIYQQAEMEQERRLFVSAIVHDLRTPLFSLRGYLEGLSNGVAESPDKREKYVAVCQEKAAALDRLVSDLFAYAQVEYLEQTPGREPLRLEALLRQTLEGLRPLADAKNVTLRLDACPDFDRFVGDAHLLTRAIENLLDNALRHTPSGGQIDVSWQRDRDWLVFRIHDSGPGFEPSDLPRVFAPLFRGESSRNRRTGGAGLGLTIARRLLLAHGGDLTAANAPDGGALLTGYLPAARSEIDAPALSESAARSVTPL